MVIAASLVFAGEAFARPQLLVTGPTSIAASGTTTIELRGAAADPAWARVTIYVPSGYTINLGHVPGTRIGTVSARGPAGPVAAANGVVLAADPNDAGVQQAATRCTQTAAHAGAWLLRIAVSPLTIDVPVFVDPTTGGESGFGSARLVLCLPLAGATFNDVKLVFSAGVFTNPLVAGALVWRSVVTPSLGDGSGPDLASTVEAQGLVGVPSSLSLKAKVKTIRGGKRVRNSVLLSGTLLENLRGVEGAKVSFFANDRSAGGASTSSIGGYAKARSLAQRTTFIATATVPTRALACVSPLPVSVAPGGCVSATRAGYRVRSNTVLVAPRRH